MAHEAPAGGRGSGVGGARGGAEGSEDLPMSRTLRFCSDLRRWSQEGGLMPARASSCASLITPWGEFLQTRSSVLRGRLPDASSSPRLWGGCWARLASPCPVLRGSTL